VKGSPPSWVREMREPVRNSSVTGDSRERPALFQPYPEWRRPHQKPVQAILAQSFRRFEERIDPFTV
jgi:hypothetical protein